jgi:hypothetical protein
MKPMMKKLSVLGAILLAGCVYDPYTGGYYPAGYYPPSYYAAAAAPPAGYTSSTPGTAAYAPPPAPYPYYPYSSPYFAPAFAYAPPIFGGVVIGSGWGWNRGCWNCGNRFAFHRNFNTFHGPD